ncbi:hypothetical protein EDD55_10179 [Varunaivibrio sulfuroxidans]|uniref:Uncharacterized protein n=1 Tax=Varunaivibrio sulfuroxidans TaxID=1773489 RepID=A0A4R3JFV3_9PROT|nr:hypothetical protein EDD55_10179 [Varunaivibrio sulfuroxidans]
MRGTSATCLIIGRQNGQKPPCAISLGGIFSPGFRATRLYPSEVQATTTLRAASSFARSTPFADAPGTIIEAMMLRHIAHSVSRAIAARRDLADVAAVHARGREPMFAARRNIAKNWRSGPTLT